MSFLELLLIAISLSFDGFVVSVGAGAQNRITLLRALKVAAVFGALHTLMPLAGWLGASSFQSLLASYGPVVGFVLILLVGMKMLKDAFSPEDVREERSIFRTRILLPLALATSVDALVVGISFAFISVPVVEAAALIGIVTFAASVGGLYLGSLTRHFLGARIQVLGALILIALAFRVLVS